MGATHWGARRLPGIAVALALAACMGIRAESLDREYESARRAGGPERIAAVGRKAKAAAERTSDARDAVPLWRIAALSEWRAAGAGAGAGDLDVLSAAGIAACEKLPEQDLSAPRDCLALRLAPLYAAHDRVARGVRALQASAGVHADAQREPALPAAQAEFLLPMFDLIARQFEETTRIRERFDDPRVPPDLLADIDAQREAMYCSAQDALVLLQLVKVTSVEEVLRLVQRDDALRARLPGARREQACSAAR